MPTSGPCHESKDESLLFSSEGGALLEHLLGNLKLLALKKEGGDNSHTYTQHQHTHTYTPHTLHTHTHTLHTHTPHTLTHTHTHTHTHTGTASQLTLSFSPLPGCLAAGFGVVGVRGSPPGVGGGWGVAKVGGGSGVMGVGGWEGCETAVISSGPVRGDGS